MEVKKRPQVGGWTPKPLEDRKVQVYGYVKRKFYIQAQKEVDEILKKYNASN